MYRRGRYPCDPCQNHPRVLATLAQNHPRVLATPESACTADPLTIFKGQFERPAKRLGDVWRSGVMCSRMGMSRTPKWIYHLLFASIFGPQLNLRNWTPPLGRLPWFPLPFPKGSMGCVYIYLSPFPRSSCGHFSPI